MKFDLMLAMRLYAARKEYKKARKEGLNTSKALARVVMNSGIPQQILVEHLKGKTGDFGDSAIADVLADSVFGQIGTPKYKRNF